MYVRVVGLGEVRVAVAGLRAAFADCDLDTVTLDELFALGDELETLGCALPAQWHRVLTELQCHTTPKEVGAKCWREVVAVRWRLSGREASRRLAEATVLGPRRSVTGEALAPVLPALAAAQAGGLLTGEHVAVIRDGLREVPGWVSRAERERLELDWVRHGVGHGPKELRDQIGLTLAEIDPDGPEPTDREPERMRRREVVIGSQRRDRTVPLTASLTPEAAALLEVLLAKYAAPGMCHPDDAEPCVSGTPSQAQIDGDARTVGQRRHDALAFVLRAALGNKELGTLTGMPTTVIVRTTLADLAARAGIAVTGGGTLMPIPDVLAMAARSDTTGCLVVFDGATREVMDCYRTRRTASTAQRWALIARDGGCTKPGCTVGAYGSQAHHARRDWAAGGHTNVDDMCLACGCDNRLVADGQWRTRLTDDHQTEWLPPPHLDHGQARVNHYHHPDRIRIASEHAFTPPDPVSEPARPRPDWSPDDPWAPTSDHDRGRLKHPPPAPPRVEDPWAPDPPTPAATPDPTTPDPTTPGGPEPPHDTAV